MILCICRLKDHYTVLSIKSFLNALKSLFCKTFLNTDSSKYTEALRLDEDLTLFALL